MQRGFCWERNSFNFVGSSFVLTERSTSICQRSKPKEAKLINLQKISLEKLGEIVTNYSNGRSNNFV